MTDFRAVTFSGAVYELRDGVLHINSKRDGVTVFKPYQMKAAKDPQGMPWNKSEVGSAWHDVDKPVVGEKFFAAGLSQWRISTEIVSVEELPEES